MTQALVMPDLTLALEHWRQDPGGTYRTWFLWEERIKNFRSIRRGLQAVVQEIEAGTFGTAYRGCTKPLDQLQNFTIMVIESRLHSQCRRQVRIEPVPRENQWGVVNRADGAKDMRPAATVAARPARGVVLSPAGRANRHSSLGCQERWRIRQPMRPQRRGWHPEGQPQALQRGTRGIIHGPRRLLSAGMELRPQLAGLTLVQGGRPGQARTQRLVGAGR